MCAWRHLLHQLPGKMQVLPAGARWGNTSSLDGGDWSQFPHLLGSFALLTKPEALWLGAQVQENAPALHMKPCHSQKKKKEKLDED